jgi:hypothetical protein
VKRASLLVIALLAGCDQTSVSFLTEVMPGRTAELDVDARTLTLSRGAAIAFECTEYTELWQGPCRDFGMKVDDDDKVEALDAIIAPAGQANETPASSSEDGQGVSGAVERTGGVLVGLEKGESDVSVRSESGRVDLTVTVIDPQAE